MSETGGLKLGCKSGAISERFLAEHLKVQDLKFEMVGK